MEREEAKTKLDYIRDNYGLTEAQIKAIDMGIEALSAPTDGDLISRQGLLLQIEKDADGSPGWYGDTWQFIKTIDSLPSADRWIPYPEQTPEVYGTYLVTRDWFGIDLAIDCWCDEKWMKSIDKTVIAWMPLPEPYKKSNEKPCTVASANVESYGESY